MKRPEILKLLQEQLPKKPPEAFVDGAGLVNDLGADSLDGLTLAMAFEEACGIEISDADLERVFGPTSTVGVIVGYIGGRTGEELEDILAHPIPRR